MAEKIHIEGLEINGASYQISSPGITMDRLPAFDSFDPVTSDGVARGLAEKVDRYSARLTGYPTTTTPAYSDFRPGDSRIASTNYVWQSVENKIKFVDYYSMADLTIGNNGYVAVDAIADGMSPPLGYDNYQLMLLSAVVRYWSSSTGAFSLVPYVGESGSQFRFYLTGTPGVVVKDLKWRTYYYYRRTSPVPSYPDGTL